jgi:two-component system chemotaxis response regulator CheY
MSRKAPNPMQNKSYGKLDVLVCDPSPHMCQLITQMLRHLKVNAVEEVLNSSAAQTALKSRKFGVIMIDDQLGPTNGIELTRALRVAEAGLNRLTPVIMMSAAPDATVIAAARDAGITEFLRKPFAAAHIESRLVSIFAAPREFIAAESYQGPDRRRRKADYQGGERRGSGAA